MELNSNESTQKAHNSKYNKPLVIVMLRSVKLLFPLQFVQQLSAQ